MCLFSKKTLEYFGFIFLKKGMKPSVSKILALKEAERSQDIKRVRSYLDMINYLKRFIPDFSMLTYPFQKRTHHNIKFESSDECVKIFQILNNFLTEKAVNKCFDEERNTVIYCDTSPVGLFSILLQKDKNDNAHVISYSSRSLTTTEQKYSQIEHEYLNLVPTCKKIPL